MWISQINMFRNIRLILEISDFTHRSFFLPSLSLNSPGFLDSSCQDAQCQTAWCWCSSWGVLAKFWGSTWMWMFPPWVCSRRACSMWGTAWAKSKTCWLNCCLWQSVILVYHLDRRWVLLFTLVSISKKQKWYQIKQETGYLCGCVVSQTIVYLT